MNTIMNEFPLSELEDIIRNVQGVGKVSLHNSSIEVHFGEIVL